MGCRVSTKKMSKAFCFAFSSKSLLRKVCRQYLVALPILVAFQSALADDEVDESAVVELTPKNFKSYVSRKSTVLVEFYAPWCGKKPILET